MEKYTFFNVFISTPIASTYSITSKNMYMRSSNSFHRKSITSINENQILNLIYFQI